MRVDGIISRLVTGAYFGSRVAGAAELDDALRGGRQYEPPAAFVVRTGDRVKQTSDYYGPLPDIEEGFQIIVKIDNRADMVGSAASDSVDSIRTQLFSDLQNWAPVAGNLPARYEGGAVGAVRDDAIYYAYSFSSLKPGAKVIEYLLTVQVVVTPGSSSETARAALETKLATTLTGTVLADKYKSGMQAITQNTVYFALRGAASGVTRDDSNLSGFEMPLELRVVKWLSNGVTEDSYTESAMTSALDTIMLPSYWTTPASVQEVIGRPNASLRDVKRS